MSVFPKKYIERLWNELESVAFEEDDNFELVLVNYWRWFNEGTPQDTIFKWFDRNYDGGIQALYAQAANC